MSGDNSKLYNFDVNSETITSIETGVISNFARKLSIDKFNRIWIGTWGHGVYRSNDNLSKFGKIELVSKKSEKTSSNYKTIVSLHNNKNNVTWLVL